MAPPTSAVIKVIGLALFSCFDKKNKYN